MEGEGAAAEGVGRCHRSGFPLSAWEVAVAGGVVAGFALGLLGVYLSMPDSDYSFLKMPRSLEDLQVLRDHLESYASDYTLQVLVGYCAVYIFMQTFMIPGTIFMSLLAGALFGVPSGVALVVFAATAGASSCFFLSKLIGRPLVISLWPDKLSLFQAQVASRKGKLLNYMLFLRVTPTLPNTFINMASPIVDVPYHTFFLATFIGLIPAAFVTVRVGMARNRILSKNVLLLPVFIYCIYTGLSPWVIQASPLPSMQAGIALGDLKSVNDLYDFQSVAALFLIGAISVTPTLLSKGHGEDKGEGKED